MRILHIKQLTAVPFQLYKGQIAETNIGRKRKHCYLLLNAMDWGREAKCLAKGQMGGLQLESEIEARWLNHWVPRSSLLSYKPDCS